MKSTGIVRKLDKLGRIVLPKELRKSLMYEEREPLEVFIEGDKIILKSYRPLCYICGSDEDLRSFKSKNICSDCRELAKQL